MQYSVIVEGTSSDFPPSDDALAELERFLLAMHIPATLLNELRDGQSKVIKQSLSYEQAVSISDKLMDFGLESAIHPPTKPEQKKPSAPPPTTEPRQTAGAKKSPVARLRPLPASTTKTPSNPRAPDAQRPTRQTAAAHLKVVPAASANRELKKVAVKAAAKTTANGHKLQATSKRSPPATPPRSQLAKAASDIKALFTLPKSAPLTDTANTRSARALLTACACVAVPAIYLTALMASFGIGLAMLAALFSSTSTISPLIAILLTLPLFAAMLFGAALLSLPLWRNRGDNEPVIIKAKDEPRLFMLVTAVAKIIGAPAPIALQIDPLPRIHGYLNCRPSDFFAFNRPVDGDITLSVGAPLLQSLSVRDLAALVAGECGRFRTTRWRRLHVLAGHGLRWTYQAKARSAIDSNIRQLAENLRSPALRQALQHFAAMAAAVQRLPFWYFTRAADYLARLTSRTDTHRTACQSAILGTDDAGETNQHLREVVEAYRLCQVNLLEKNASQRFVDSLPLYTDYLLKRVVRAGAKFEGDADRGIVRSSRAAVSLVDHFNRYALQTTRACYASHGLDPDKLDILTLDELFQVEHQETRAQQIAKQYFGQWFSPLQFWQLNDEGSLTGDVSDIVARLNACIARVRFLSPDRGNLLTHHDRLIKQIAELEAAKKAAAAGINFTLQYCNDASKDLDREIAVRTGKLKEVDHDLRQQNSVMGERLHLGLLLSQRSDPETKATAAKLSKALDSIACLSQRVERLQLHVEELQHLLHYKPKRMANHYRLHVRDLKESIDEAIKACMRRLHQCPFDFHDRRHTTVGAFVAKRVDVSAAASEQQSVARAVALLEGIAKTYRSISNTAAHLACEMESKHKVETIRKVAGGK